MLFKYNQPKSVLYAKNYVKHGNPFYKVFHEGEDCSFVSQCLLAGCELGGKLCDEWFYENEKNFSLSWSDRAELLRYLLSKAKCGPSGRIANLSNLTAGDLIFFELNGRKTEVGVVSKIENDKVYYISRNGANEEKELEINDEIKKYFIHIVGVKK